jgi:hypothetical protein
MILRSYRQTSTDIANKIPALQEFHDSSLYLIRAKSAVLFVWRINNSHRFQLVTL